MNPPWIARPSAASSRVLSSGSPNAAAAPRGPTATDVLENYHSKLANLRATRPPAASLCPTRRRRPRYRVP